MAFKYVSMRDRHCGTLCLVTTCNPGSPLGVSAALLSIQLKANMFGGEEKTAHVHGTPTLTRDIQSVGLVASSWTNTSYHSHLENKPLEIRSWGLVQ